MASINTALLDANCVFSTTDFRDFFSSIIDDTAPTTALTTTSWINHHHHQQQQQQQQQQELEQEQEQQSLFFPSYIGNTTSTADYMVPTTESSNDHVNYNANSSDPLFGAVMLPDRPLFEVPIFNNTMLHVDDHDDQENPYHHHAFIMMDDHHHHGRFVDMINNGDHNHQYMQQKHQEAYDHDHDHDQFIISTTAAAAAAAAAADHRENFNQFVSDFQPLMYGRSDSNWGIEGRTLMLGNMEEANVKVRRYSMEERKDRIMKYLKKRNQRNFNKTIKYACRKTLADRRIRVRGRFARNNEVGGEEVPMAASMSTTNININQLDRDDEYYDTCAEIIKEQNIGEEWLQDAVTSLMYLPIFAG